MHRFFEDPKISCPVPFADLCVGSCIYRPYMNRKTYQRSEIIYPQGSKINSFGIVLDGILKAVSHTVNGDELCNAYFEKNDIFPELLYFSGKRYYTYTLVAAKKSTVAWIPVEILEEMLERDNLLMYSLLLYISQRGLKDQLYLNCLNYQTIRERIAYWIVGMNDTVAGAAIPMPVSQSVMANMLHVSRSSLNQELKLMEKEGFFSIQGQEMHIKDVERLQEML